MVPQKRARAGNRNFQCWLQRRRHHHSAGRPWVVVRFGWRWAFLITGALGFAWLILWLLLYRKPQDHPRCTQSERAYIEDDSQSSSGKIHWAELLAHKQTWAIAAGKFITDPVWWFFLFCIPYYLL